MAAELRQWVCLLMLLALYPLSLDGFAPDEDEATAPMRLARTADRSVDAYLESQDKGEHTLISPGAAIDGLSLGDTKQRTSELFPAKPNIDQEWLDECGTTYNWVDTERGSSSRGNVFVRFQNGKVSQIETSTTRYHTADGITTFDSPLVVQRHYPSLQAFALLGSSTLAFGDRPLIFWVDWSRGIAFVFAYYPREASRYLYKIIVFKPRAEFCAEGRRTTTSNWKILPAYSVELPDNKAGFSDLPHAGGPQFAGLAIVGFVRHRSGCRKKSSKIVL